MKQMKIFKAVKIEFEYFLMFFVALFYWEMLMRFTVYKEDGLYFVFLFFLPAEALFFTFLTGLSKNRKVNKILAVILLFAIFIFYAAQFLYYRQFDSLFSVSFIKMGGEAITGFWWAFKDTLLGSVGYLLLLMLPLVAAGLLFSFDLLKAEGIRLIKRPFIAVFIIFFWLLGIAGIRLMGTEKASPYDVFKDAYVSTDTSGERLGVMTTSVLEAGTYFFGIEAPEKETSLNPITVEIPTVSVDKPIVGDTPTVDNEEHFEEEPVEEIKYHALPGVDFEYLKSIESNEDIKSLCDYFLSKAPAKHNEYTGLFEGCNLIYICAESFTTYAMNEKLTPLLCKMSREGIVLNNYYTSFKNTTTNGEFAYSVSLWPDVSRKAANGNAVGSFACSAENYMPYGLGNIFKKIDVPTHAYHGYISSYYRRCDSWPNLGYENMKFMKEGLSFRNKWSPGDTELMEQTVGEYVNKDRFFTYYMTYSGHGAYTTATYMYIKNYKAVRDLLGENDYTDSEISYFCGNYELEKALEYLVEELEKAGCLENTVIVLAGDHIPYNFTTEEMEDMSKKAGLPFDKNFEKYRSTCIIYKAGMEEPIVSDAYCCNVDVLPTVLNLLGIEYDSRMIAGIDVFDEGFHRARLYNGNLLTEYVNYNAEAKKNKATWKEASKDWSEEEKQKYLEMLLSYSESEYAVSLKLMDTDFYRFVWKNLK